MLTLRTSSPYELFDRLEQQLSQQLQTAERVPAAEVLETAEAFTVVLELPGVDRTAIDVKATDRTLVITAERRPAAAAVQDSAANGAGSGEPQATNAERRLISEFRYGTWSRSFRFPSPIERDRLEARYRDGLLTVIAPKAVSSSSVRVVVDG
jgi:HSP20 family protein